MSTANGNGSSNVSNDNQQPSNGGGGAAAAAASAGSSNGIHQSSKHHLPPSSNHASHTNSFNSSNYVYRVGDFVYIETSPLAPFQVCKIDEFIKNPNGNEVRLVLFYRRRDISNSLIQLVEKQVGFEEEQETELEQLPEKMKHQVKLREVYLSPQIETFPVQCIRGKCTVALLSEAETLVSYLDKDDAFYYQYVYDPSAKTLSEADRGEIRVGQRYQAETPPKPLENPSDEDERLCEQLETMLFTCSHNLGEDEIEDFVTVAKSIGTYARALDCSSSVKLPNLQMGAASASRDVTLQKAMDILHEVGYDFGKAVRALVPHKCPVLCRDQMEEWSSSEASLFEEGFEKYDKDFRSIRQDFLPWKTMTNIIEYYYMWKTTDRYVQQKRVKAVENENKLKQVYVPNHNKAHPDELVADANKQCESCKKTLRTTMIPWGPAHYQYFVCSNCWDFWKKFGSFKNQNRSVVDLNSENKLSSSLLANQSGSGSINTNNNSSSINPSGNNLQARPPQASDLSSSNYVCQICQKAFNRLERLTSHMASHKLHKCNVSACGKEFKFKSHLQRHHSTTHGGMPRSGSPRPVMKTRAAFYHVAEPSLRYARRVCAEVLDVFSAARKPFAPINLAGFKQDYQIKYARGVAPLPKLVNRFKNKVNDVSHRLGTPKQPRPEWLIPTPKDKIPKPEKLTFPPTPANENLLPAANRKRPLDQNGHSTPSKRRQMAPPSILGKSMPDLYENLSRNAVSTSLNGRAKVTTITNVAGKKQMISWVDAPDDVYFVANEQIKQMRKKVTSQELRRSARRPWKRCDKSLAVPSSSSASASGASASASSVAAHLAATLTSPAGGVGVPPSASTAAALAGLSRDQVAALLAQQQLLAQNLPLLSNNHFGAAGNFLGLPTNNSSNNNTAGKLSR